MGGLDELQSGGRECGVFLEVILPAVSLAEDAFAVHHVRLCVEAVATGGAGVFHGASLEMA